jgi:hypothetical protein
VVRLFVLCPAGYVTGGPEALHQLVHVADRLGFDASIVYFPQGHPAPTAPVFAQYRAPVAPYVVDAPDSLVVVPETEAPRLFELGRAQRGLWWLSVDNFVSRNEAARLAAQKSAQAATGPLDVVYDRAARCLHLTQSHYARTHVTSRGLTASMLTDYLRAELVEAAREAREDPKDDIVVYNPAKGAAFTQRLIEASAPGIEWVALQGLSPLEVAALLGRAKVYVDFGNHPGRDRIPREAALCGAAVLTGRRGSAGNDVDVPIPAAYKFDDEAPGVVGQVLGRIEEVLKDHAGHAARFAGYRETIEAQERAFTDEVFRVLAAVEAHQARTLAFAR